MQDCLSEYVFLRCAGFLKTSALIAGLLCLTPHELPLIQELQT